MKVNSQAVTISLVTLLSLSVLALAGCGNTSAPTDTKESDTKVEDSKSEDTKAEDTKAEDAKEESAAAEVKTPDGAKELTNTGMGSNKVVTYNVEAAVDAACEDQAKMVADAGWKASSTMPDPIKAAGAWTQTFESGKMMLVLACAESPVTTGMTMVTMTQAENMMQ